MRWWCLVECGCGVWFVVCGVLFLCSESGQVWSGLVWSDMGFGAERQVTVRSTSTPYKVQMSSSGT